MNTWHSTQEPAPEGVRLLFFSLEFDYVFVGVTRGGHWFDEADYDEHARSTEIFGVTHWMSLPASPFAAPNQGAIP